MNFENDLKQQARKLEIPLDSGRIDSVVFSKESDGADWILAEKTLDAISGAQLAEAKTRLGLAESTPLGKVHEELKVQLTMFRFSFHAWLESYGEVDPDGPLMWISDGTSFEDDFHRSAWILAGCGVLQASTLVCRGFDVPSEVA